MKKLVMLITVAAASVMTHAATFDWATQPNSWASGAPAAGNAYVVVFASDAAASTDLGKAIAAASKADMVLALGADGFQKSEGTFATAYGNAMGSLYPSVPSGTAMDVIMIAFNAATIAEADQFFVSNPTSGKAYAATATSDRKQAVWSANAGVGPKVTGTWTDFASVPEPNDVQVPSTLSPVAVAAH